MIAIDVLQRSPLFASVGRSTLGQMAGVLTAGRWPKNSEIPIADETAQRIMIVVEGRVKITCSNQHNGRELTLWLLGPGDAFDVVSLLDGERHAVAAWALDDVQVLSAPVSLFHQWLESYPGFRRSVHRYIAVRLREITQLAGSLALHDAMTRLIFLLLRHVDDSKNPAQAKINLIRDLSHEELAFLIGSVRVVVSRLIGQLKRAGVVNRRGGDLRIQNPKRLARRTEEQVGRASGRSRRDRLGN